MDENHQLAKIWNLVAEVDQEDLTKPVDLREPPASWIYNLKGGLCLEAGCGGGRFSVYVASLGNEVVSLDVSKKMITLCKKHSKKCGVNDNNHLVLGDVRALPFKHEVFDLILCLGVIEHFQETQLALQELARTTKGSRSIIVSVPNLISFFHIAKCVAQCIDQFSLGYERSYTKYQFKRMLESVHLSKIKIALHEICLEKQRIPWKRVVLWIMKVLDKPIFLARIGGHFLIFKGEKKKSLNIRTIGCKPELCAGYEI